MYFIYISKTYNLIHEPLLLYVNGLIPLYTSIFYACNLLLYLIFGINKTTFIIYYTEWAIVTPIFIISLSHILKLSYKNMLILSFIDVLFIVAGATMEILSSTDLKYIPFTFGVICYLGIFIYLYTKYTKLNRIPIKTILYNNSITIYKCISIFTISSWSLYPILTLLHHTDNISNETTILSYSLLDIISKNVFILIIYYYVLTINNIPHWFDWFTKKRLQIVPLPATTTTASTTALTTTEEVGISVLDLT
jgi:bacteriorhodopsin